MMLWHHVQIGFRKFWKEKGSVKLSKEVPVSTNPAPIATILIGRAKKALGRRFDSRVICKMRV